MSKHTPGPWARRPGTLSVQGGDGKLVANALSGTMQRVADGPALRSRQEAEANAALVAAAPELLAALQAILEVDHPDADFSRMVERAKRIARNAIEKVGA